MNKKIIESGKKIYAHYSNDIINFMTEILMRDTFIILEFVFI